ncbi:4Fe-4S dicluster domain-containing protein [Malonomonas rubra DSM 5091]|uniref:4Fe-4S dicluster domain-containing protein n=1 Tax=Malonomonas rubra DSM 5091 TaxID=1122189 RepID=A0A1M6IKF0_MALRU|nr:4Fe-4S dicluster domain-containing protein [Malonomonas rubra]SHJ34920.1 4Fe-4S dicluster domain-containing protein [Malonomonas rubra DSM 5091]
MLKSLKREDLLRLLETLAEQYDLQVPLKLPDGTRQLGRYGSGELSLCGPLLQRKPTSLLFPQAELLLSINPDGSVEQPHPAEKPLALFGLERSDLAAIAFLDRFFLCEPADDIYQGKRENSLLIGLTGFAGENSAYLPPAGENCDLELIATADGWLGCAYSAAGKTLLAPFPDSEAKERTEIDQRAAEPKTDSLLKAASRLLREDKVPDAFWQEIADRCILCTGCNLVCPTCSCFCVQDRIRDGKTERSRVWDSCQLDAFMREASGHNPLGTEALRTRRRIHHKLVADVERWGEIGCIACGRCDRTCPTGIGMFAVVEEMINQFG